MRSETLASVPAGALTSIEALDCSLDALFDGLRSFGMAAMIYDYTPALHDAKGEVMPPSLMRVRNLSPSIIDYWCNLGYARIDPVQAVAVRSVSPFIWSYDADAGAVSSAYLTQSARPVVDFMNEAGLGNGITVPIHLPGGGYVTVTGLGPGSGSDFAALADQVKPSITLCAQAFQDAAGPMPPYGLAVTLTPRERECLGYAGAGLSAKEISREIGRSVPTVVMHLNAAARKLGARNRSHAVAEAVRRRLV